MRINTKLNLAFTNWKISKATAGDYYDRASEVYSKSPAKAFRMAMLAVEKIQKSSRAGGVESKKDIRLAAEAYLTALSAIADSKDPILRNIYAEALSFAKKAGLEDRAYAIQCSYLSAQIGLTQSNYERLRLANEGISVAGEWFSKYRDSIDIPPSDSAGAMQAAALLFEFLNAKSNAKKSIIEGSLLGHEATDRNLAIAVSVVAGRLGHADLSEKADDLSRKV